MTTKIALIGLGEIARAQHVPAIACGRHVMLEKPPGATVSECAILQQLAAAAGVTCLQPGTRGRRP